MSKVIYTSTTSLPKREDGKSNRKIAYETLQDYIETNPGSAGKNRSLDMQLTEFPDGSASIFFVVREKRSPLMFVKEMMPKKENHRLMLYLIVIAIIVSVVVYW